MSRNGSDQSAKKLQAIFKNNKIGPVAKIESFNLKNVKGAYEPQGVMPR